MTYELTPADLMDLRAKMRSVGTLRSEITAESCSIPFIVYSTPTKEYCLQGQGMTLAVSDRAEVICWLLAQERHEAGYVRSLLRPDLPVDLALSPEKRAAAKREEHAFYAALRASEAEELARRQRRAKQVHQKPEDHADLTLDELI